MFDLTIVICTYNGAARLPRVLDGLRSQVNTAAFSWAVLVVDNNSSDTTAQVVQQQQASWPSSWPLLYVFEPQQGLAFARRCAMRHSTSELIGFLDDDNWPAANWVAEAYAFGAAAPKVGAYGSQITAAYEQPPPPGFERIASCLAIMPEALVLQPYPPLQWRFPAGAGLVVRRQAWLEAVPATPQLKGVCGQALSAKGEDLESLSHLNRAGWQIWHNPAMQIVHHIPAARLEPPYLIRLCRGIGLGRYPTRRVRFAAWQWPCMLLLFGLNDLRRLTAHLLRFPPGRTDVVSRCERTLLIYSLLSPLYYSGRRAIAPLQRRWSQRRYGLQPGASAKVGP